MSYAAFVFFPLDAALSLDDAEACLRAFFETSQHPSNGAVHIQRQSDSISMTRDRWSLYIASNCQPPAHVDSQAVSVYLAQVRPELVSRISYGCRWEIFSDKDRTLDYFNDYLLVIEQLAQLPGAAIYDYTSGTFV